MNTNTSNSAIKRIENKKIENERQSALNKILEERAIEARLQREQLELRDKKIFEKKSKLAGKRIEEYNEKKKKEIDDKIQAKKEYYHNKAKELKKNKEDQKKKNKEDKRKQMREILSKVAQKRKQM